MVRLFSPGFHPMLTLYQPQNGGLKGTVSGAGGAIVRDAVWFDLLEPSEEERNSLSTLIGVKLPSRADMEEIEISSHLYQEGRAVYMTALLLANSESDHPVADAVTFVLTHENLVTLRYVDPTAFRLFAARCDRGNVPVQSPEGLQLLILDAIVDRLADILERLGSDIEAISRQIFSPETIGTLDTRAYQTILGTLGRKNDLTGKLRESLLSISRLLSFFTQHVDERADKDVRVRTQSLARDLQSLQDHSSYLAGKLNYLLEATLGMINIDQNNIIKMMSIAATVFLPPTLIASILNFKYMPSLASPWGYPLSVVLMLGSAIVPYLWFKRRGWL
jgi:magnesium transporter